VGGNLQPTESPQQNPQVAAGDDALATLCSLLWRKVERRLYNGDSAALRFRELESQESIVDAGLNRASTGRVAHRTALRFGVRDRAITTNSEFNYELSVERRILRQFPRVTIPDQIHVPLNDSVYDFLL